MLISAEITKKNLHRLGNSIGFEPRSIVTEVNIILMYLLQILNPNLDL